MKANQDMSPELVSLVGFIRQHKLEAPAIFMLESLHPLRGTFSHLSHFADPLGKLIAPVWTKAAQELFADPEVYQQLIKAFEQESDTSQLS